MSMWTKLVRYVSKDGNIRLGQPIDLAQDVGLAAAGGHPFKVNVIQGDVFNGTVSSEEDTAEKLLSPIGRQDCSLIRCLGLNYFGHANESNFPIPKEPILFIKPRTALAGPGEIAVAKAAQDDQLDYETELALVIGKDALDVSVDEAMSYVLGFTCANDVSVRKFQLANQQWCFGKGFDQTCPIGPALVRTGHIDPDRLHFKGVLSGETVQEDNTSDMIFNCARTVSFLSQGTTLEKGTIILMGTPSGIGWFRDPKRIIKHGETMTITFEAIGSLVNTFNYV